MLKSYPAVLRDGQIEWTGEIPPESPDGKAVPVEVRVLPPSVLLTPEERRNKLADILERMAARGGIRSIPDPVEWQRDIRKDRSLPGRDE